MAGYPLPYLSLSHWYGSSGESRVQSPDLQLSKPTITTGPPRLLEGGEGGGGGGGEGILTRPHVLLQEGMRAQLQYLPNPGGLHRSYFPSWKMLEDALCPHGQLRENLDEARSEQVVFVFLRLPHWLTGIMSFVCHSHHRHHRRRPRRRHHHNRHYHY